MTFSLPPDFRLRSALAILLFLSIASASKTSRFQHFFPNSAEVFQNVSTNTCNATLKAFQDAYVASDHKLGIHIGTPSSERIVSLCRAHEECILQNTSIITKIELGNAGIILGLLPTLLAILNPSLGETSLLAQQRPFLALLTGLGSPGIFQMRVFEYMDPGEILDVPADLDGRKRTRVKLLLGPWKRNWLTSGVAIFEYLLIVGAAANMFHLAVQLTFKSVLIWGCTRTWPVILWASFPIIIKIISALGYRLTLDPKRSSTRQSSVNTLAVTMPETPKSFFTKVERSTTTSAVAPGSAYSNNEPAAGSRPSVLKRILRFLERGLVPCACHPVALRRRLNVRDPSIRVTTGITIQCLAGLLSYFHLVYGTATLPALLFITTLDAVMYIATRFLASSLICRFVVLLEIAGMRGAFFANQSQPWAN